MRKSTAVRFTENDFELLSHVVAWSPESLQVKLLERELERGEVYTEASIPDNVVTLYSRAIVYDETRSKERELTVVPPDETDEERGRVSVLAPIGAAVIGLAEGNVIEWPLPSGSRRRFRVDRLLYQPEAAQRRREELFDLAADDSFPASDPPGCRL